MRCLARRMLREAGEDDCEVIPSEGVCWVPTCARRLLWSWLVKGVQVYHPRVSSSSEDGRVAVDRGPPVWRVHDSSDDDDDDVDGEGSECGSDLAAWEDEAGWSSGVASASRDLLSENEEEGGEEDDDDSFWKLSGGRSGCSQAGRTGGSSGARGTRPISSCGGKLGRDCRTSSLRDTGRMVMDKACGGGHTPFVHTVKRSR